jgi:hypothetical protein
MMSQTSIDYQAAEDAMENVNPDASDQAIAEILANYLLRWRPSHRRTYRLSIFHDVHPSALRRWQKLYPDRRPSDVGPCPLPYDWIHKNTVGIATRDRALARQWIIDAALAGYAVFRHLGAQYGGFGQGSIEDIRNRRREWTDRRIKL